MEIGVVRVCDSNHAELLVEGDKTIKREGCGMTLGWRITCNYTGIGDSQMFNHTLFHDQVLVQTNFLIVNALFLL